MWQSQDYKQFKFNEVTVPSTNGYPLPGWLIRSAENGYGGAKGAIMLVHGGGGELLERKQITLLIF